LFINTLEAYLRREMRYGFFLEILKVFFHSFPLFPFSSRLCCTTDHSVRDYEVLSRFAYGFNLVLVLEALGFVLEHIILV
jgi:hypothetical protein